MATRRQKKTIVASKNPTDVHVGGRVRMRRMMLGMTQQTLARHIGVTLPRMEIFEKGEKRIGATKLQQIASEMQIPVSFFFENAPKSALDLSSKKKQRKAVKRVVIRSRVQVIFYSKLIIKTVERELDEHAKSRHHNGPPTTLIVDDEHYLQELRSLVFELKRLNDLLETTRRLADVPKAPVSEVKKALSVFLEKYAGAVAVGTGALSVGLLAALLHQLGAGDMLFQQLQNKILPH